MLLRVARFSKAAVTYVRSLSESRWWRRAPAPWCNGGMKFSDTVMVVDRMSGDSQCLKICQIGHELLRAK